MAQLLDATAPRSKPAQISMTAAMLLLVAGWQFPTAMPVHAASAVDVDLGVLKTLPKRKSDAASPPIELTPPPSIRKELVRREAARRRAEAKAKAERKRRDLEAKKRAEEERRAAEAKQRAEEARRKAEAKRRAKNERRQAKAEAKAKAARKANDRAAQRKAPAAPQNLEKINPSPKTARVRLPANKFPAGSTRLAFGKGSAKLSAGAVGKLSPILKRMTKNNQARLVIYAYAAGTGARGNNARRLSLSRALAVRRHLMAKGIAGTRTEIRALGDRTKLKPIDRVDLVVVQR